MIWRPVLRIAEKQLVKIDVVKGRVKVLRALALKKLRLHLRVGNLRNGDAPRLVEVPVADVAVKDDI